MPVVETMSRQAVTVKLDAGTTETGRVKTVSVSLPGVRQDLGSRNDDLDNVMAIVDLLAPIFDDDIYSVMRYRDTNLSA